MVNGRNRVTPILVIILIVVFWIFIGVLIYKLQKNRVTEEITRLKIDDDLVQELYSYTTDEDIMLYSDKKYDVTNLPSEYIFSKASRFLTLEDIYLKKGQFYISYDALDGAIKTAFGPDMKYDISNINSNITTGIDINDRKLILNVKYNSKSKKYYGTYKFGTNKAQILVSKKLLSATKSDTVNLEVGYVFYKYDTNYKICNDKTCSKIIEEIDNIDDYDYNKKTVTISLKKASDDVYYYEKNN